MTTVLESNAEVKDPIQKALRNRKKVWNKEVKRFVDNVINLKKLINGSPSKFHMEKSKITDPLPQNPPSIIENLINEFSDIAVEGNAIVSDQLNYAKSRGTKTENTQSPIKQPEVIEAPDLTKELSVPSPLTAETTYELVSQGSGRISRFVSRLRGPWFGSSTEAEQRRKRLELLDTTKELYDLCSDFQYEVLSTKDDGILKSIKIMKKIEDKLFQLSSSIEVFLPEKKKDKEDKSEKDKKDKLEKTDVPEEMSIVTGIINDWSRNASTVVNELPDLAAPKMMKLINDFNEAKDAKLILAKRIIEFNNQVMAALSAKYNKAIVSLEEIVNMNVTASENLQIVADKKIRRWIRKLRQQLPFAGKHSAIKLEASKIVEELMEFLDKMMNSLEKSLEPEDLIPRIKDIGDKYRELSDVMSTIGPEAKYDKPTSLFSDKFNKDLEKKLRNKEMDRMVRRLMSVR